MNKYIIRRLLQMIPTLFFSTLFLFLMLNIMKGDAVDIYFGMSEDRTPEAVAFLRKQLGIDKPIPVQYALWLSRAVQGNFGESWRFREPVLSMITKRIQLSFELWGVACLISVLGSSVLGMFLAAHQNSVADQVIRFIGLIFLSAPQYWVALALMLFLSRAIGWIPPIRYVTLAEDWKTHLEIIALPSVLWGVFSIPSFSRYVRNAVLDVLSSDYVRTARAKGLPERRVLFGHVLRNAAGPLATVTGLSAGAAAGGSLLMEMVFSLPGMGRLYYTAIGQRDYPLVMGGSLIISIIFIFTTLVTDLSYAWFDPRVRYK